MTAIQRCSEKNQVLTTSFHEALNILLNTYMLSMNSFPPALSSLHKELARKVCLQGEAKVDIGALIFVPGTENYNLRG